MIDTLTAPNPLVLFFLVGAYVCAIHLMDPWWAFWFMQFSAYF